MQQQPISSKLPDSTPLVNPSDILVCSTYSKIYAISKRNGARIWRQDFPSGFLGGGSSEVISLYLTGNNVIAGAGGKIVCLNLINGRTKWTNAMEGMGYHEVGVVGNDHTPMAPADSASSSSMGVHNELPPSYVGQAQDPSLIFACSRGKVLALQTNTGQTAWRFNCPGGGYHMPAVLTEPRYHGTMQWPHDVVYVGCGQVVYCLQAHNGGVLWSSAISNAISGHGYMCMATLFASQVRSHCYTDNSTIPHQACVDIEERRRRRRRH
ncbi:Quino protein alcohol dehydrogenase-like protein [Hesseltinella vesiculosa]|uniref:Quino protein alcohol dehydrogenase-like protein n=1 Tax=Hesseltinella vesiculosa TaxID=101127 RepID=A0A1X2GEY9_9FUNG|nr:Quino protein alcohol dehydrogenase-like protein [Hesseltinella vesiculosa]